MASIGRQFFPPVIYYQVNQREENNRCARIKSIINRIFAISLVAGITAFGAAIYLSWNIWFISLIVANIALVCFIALRQQVNKIANIPHYNEPLGGFADAAALMMPPQNIEKIPAPVLKRVFAGEPNQYNNVPYGGVELVLDATELSVDTIACKLIADQAKMLITRVAFVHLPALTPVLQDALLQITGLRRLVFRDCPHLELSSNFLDFTSTLRHLQRIDFQGNTPLGQPLFESLSKRFVVFSNLLGSNKESMLKAFHDDLSAVSIKLLVFFIRHNLNDAQRSLMSEEKGTDYNCLVHRIQCYKELLECLEKPKPTDQETLRLRHDLIKTCLPQVWDELAAFKDLYIKENGLPSLLADFTDALNNKAYAPVFESRFTLDLSMFLLCDDSLSFVLKLLQKKANVECLNLSGSQHITLASSLRHGIGLPLHTLYLRRLPKMDNDALAALPGFFKLAKLDLSGSSLSNEGLLSHVIKTAGHLKILEINDCQNVTGTSLEEGIIPMLASLEMLACCNIGTAPYNLGSNLKAIARHAGDYATKPFVIFSQTECGDLRLSITAPSQMPRVLDYIRMFVQKAHGQMFKDLYFGAFSQVKPSDIEELQAIGGLKFTSINLRHVIVKPDLYPVILRWPFIFLKIQGFNISLMNRNAETGTVEELSIDNFRSLNQGIWDFLHNFTKIQRLTINRSHFLTEKDILELMNYAALCGVTQLQFLHVTVDFDIFNQKIISLAQKNLSNINEGFHKYIFAWPGLKRFISDNYIMSVLQENDEIIIELTEGAGDHSLWQLLQAYNGNISSLKIIGAVGADPDFIKDLSTLCGNKQVSTVDLSQSLLNLSQFTDEEGKLSIDTQRLLRSLKALDIRKLHIQDELQRQINTFCLENPDLRIEMRSPVREPVN